MSIFNTFLIKHLWRIFRSPEANVYLMLDKAQDDEGFYRKFGEMVYEMSVAPHPRYKIMPHFKFGMNVLLRPSSFDQYFSMLSSKRRNAFRRLEKQGITVGPFHCDDYLEDITEIWRSTPIRQGRPVSEDFYEEQKAANNPVSHNHFHDYPYFGAFYEGKLIAYASMSVCGEFARFHDFLNHDKYRNIPALSSIVIDFIRLSYECYPQVKYVCMGRSLSASHYLIRTNLGFRTYNLNYFRGDRPKDENSLLIYRSRFEKRIETTLPEGVEYFSLKFGWRFFVPLFSSLFASLGFAERCRVLLRFILYRNTYTVCGLRAGNTLLSYTHYYQGISCYYSVSRKVDHTISDVLTMPEHRKKGYAQLLLQLVISDIVMDVDGMAVLYVHTHLRNTAMRCVLEKVGFGEPFATI